MGTGPWPQPPTEAEQLQALMAAANGESDTVPSFYLSFPPSCQLSFSLLGRFISLCVHTGAWEVVLCVASRATSQTQPLIKRTLSTLMFP